MNAWPLFISLAVKSTAVLVAAALLSFALARRSAAARHLVWTGAFAILLALPVLALALPSWPQRFANTLLPGPTFTVQSAAAATAGAHRVAPVSTSPSAAPTLGRVFDLRRAALLAWTCGALFAFLHMLASYFALARLRRRASPAPFLAGDLGIPEDVPLFEADHGMPMTAGVLRPAIFLPGDAHSWPADRLRMVVTHEYAHVRRGDAAAHLLARAALCLFWFHPLAWFAWRESIKERERAADDLVLQSGAAAADYADHLLAIARAMSAVPAARTAALAIARPSHLEARLRAILDGRIRRAGHGRAGLAAAILAALLVAAPLATVRAQSPAEQAPPPDVATVIFRANAEKNHEILDRAAVRYEDLQKFDEARKLREAALALRKQESTASYAEGLVQLGELAERHHAGTEALEYYRQAAALGDMPATVPALIALGLNAAFADKDTKSATGYLERARNAARDNNQIGRAMTWLAFVQQDDPARAAGAESLYRTALSLEDPGSSVQALTTDLLASLLRSQQRTGEAAALRQEAAALHRALVARLTGPLTLTTANGPRKVGAGVTPPSLIAKVEPGYSEAARAIKFQGTVLLHIVVDVDGRAKDIQVVRGLGLGLDEKAVEAVTKWMFAPGQADGVPVPVQAQIEVNFRLL